jgi:hypothetical protein
MACPPFHVPGADGSNRTSTGGDTKTAGGSGVTMPDDRIEAF